MSSISSSESSKVGRVPSAGISVEPGQVQRRNKAGVIKMCMGDDYSINFLGLDVHWENGLTFEQDAIVHQYVGVVTVDEKRRAADLLRRSQNLNFQFVITI